MSSSLPFKFLVGYPKQTQRKKIQLFPEQWNQEPGAGKAPGVTRFVAQAEMSCACILTFAWHPRLACLLCLSSSSWLASLCLNLGWNWFWDNINRAWLMDLKKCKGGEHEVIKVRRSDASDEYLASRTFKERWFHSFYKVRPEVWLLGSWKYRGQIVFPTIFSSGVGITYRVVVLMKRPYWARKALTGMLVEDPQWYRESAQVPLAYRVSILESLDAGAAFWSCWQ